MIYFVTRQDHDYAIRQLLLGLGREFRMLKPISYERLFRFRRAPDVYYRR